MIETPAQKNAILTWTEQRDNLLKEIGVLKTEKEAIQKENKEEAASAEELRLKSAEIQGRIDVLEVLENRQKSSLSIEIVGDLSAAGSMQIIAVDSDSTETILGTFELADGQGLTLQDVTGQPGRPRFEFNPDQNAVMRTVGGTFTGTIARSIRN